MSESLTYRKDNPTSPNTTEERNIERFISATTRLLRTLWMAWAVMLVVGVFYHLDLIGGTLAFWQALALEVFLIPFRRVADIFMNPEENP